MHILFCHQNFPAQFGHIAKHLIQEKGYTCSFVSEKEPGVVEGIRRIQYKAKSGATARTHYCSRTFENYMWHSHGMYEALKQYPDVQPDLVVAHSGFGSSLFLKELYDCPIINYYEWFYHVSGSDLDFRREHEVKELTKLRIRPRNAGLLCDLQNCDLGYCPTQWQRSQFPKEYQYKLTTIFDGIDTKLWKSITPEEIGPKQIGESRVPEGYKLITYVSRGFESMRGFDIFMEVARRICQRRKDVVFVCVGTDRICYGNDMDRIDAKSYRHYILSQADYDLNRFLFPGRLPASDLARVLNMSDLHIYLTVPFVLSWSMMNALSCGCTVLASDTPPVQEMIRHGTNGLLAPFFDVDTFADLACEVLDDPQGYKQSLGAKAVETIQSQYTMEKCLPAMLDLYERAISGQPLTHGESFSADSRPLRLDRSRVGEARTFQQLHELSSWPEQPPTIAPSRQIGPPDANRQKLWDQLFDLAGAPSLILESGASMGLETVFLLEHNRQANLVATNSWPPSGEDRPQLSWKTTLPDIHERFLANCWQHRGRVAPLSLPTPIALRLLCKLDPQPDVIVIHCNQIGEFEQDVTLARELFPQSIIVGDNWKWSAIRYFVESHSQGCQLISHGNVWALRPTE